MAEDKKLFVISNEVHSVTVKRGIQDHLEDTTYEFTEVNKPIEMPVRTARGFGNAHRNRYRVFEKVEDIIPFELEPQAENPKEEKIEPVTEEKKVEEPESTQTLEEVTEEEGPFDAAKWLENNLPITEDKLKELDRADLFDVAEILEVKDIHKNTPTKAVIKRILEVTKTE